MIDLLLVCLGATAGLRTADDELEASLQRAGADVARVTARAPREVRTFAATDLLWARAARTAAVAGLAAHHPRVVLYSTTTAALLWPRPGAIRFDALAAATRPGRHGLWQRPVEARRLAAAPVLVPMVATPGLPGDPVVVPIPVEPSGPTDGTRDVSVLTYGANWRKKGLDRVLAAWRAFEPQGEVLVVAGIEPDLVAGAWSAGGGTGPLPASVRVTGRLAPEAYRALLRRTRVFVSAPRREDYGIAQLEALADGCALVTTTAPGPYAALAVARGRDPRLVVEDVDDPRALATALRLALADPAPPDTPAGPARTGTPAGPAPGAPADPTHFTLARATESAARDEDLAPFTRAAADRVVAECLLPRLLG